VKRKPENPDAENAKDSEEYKAFSNGLKKILKTPKSEVDKREAQWRKSKTRPQT